MPCNSRGWNEMYIVSDGALHPQETALLTLNTFVILLETTPLKVVWSSISIQNMPISDLFSENAAPVSP